MNDLIQEINNVRQSGKRIRKYKTPELYKRIMLATQFLPGTAKIKERIFCIENNITARPTCRGCGIETIFLGPYAGYRKYCSTKCAGGDPELKKKKVETNIKKFGTKTPAESDHIKQKTKDILKQKYGENITTTQQIPEVLAKTKKTNIEKYNSEWYTTSQDYKNKTQETYDLKYRGRFPNQQHINENAWNILNDRDQLHELNKTLNLYEIAAKLNVSISLISRIFEKHNLPLILKFNNSVPEQELKDFCLSLNIEVEFNNRLVLRPKELDVFFPQQKLAIEFCGLYWHSDIHERITKTYHQEKYLRCKELGITLLTFFEDEWYEKREIVKSIIKHKLGLSNQHTIFARNCEIRCVNNNDRDTFFNLYHIQGAGHGSITYGLFNNNELVACMTFLQHKKHIELNRYATKYNIPGGLSKLLQFYIKQHSPSVAIITYADCRYSEGNAYVQTGFDYLSTSKPGYCYISGKQRFHRRQFVKKLLCKRIKNFDSNLTEWENTDLNNLNRIWDCGQMKFVYKKHIKSQ